MNPEPTTEQQEPDRVDRRPSFAEVERERWHKRCLGSSAPRGLGGSVMPRTCQYTVEIKVGWYGSWEPVLPSQIVVKASSVSSAVRQALGVVSRHGALPRGTALWRIKVARQPTLNGREL